MDQPWIWVEDRLPKVVDDQFGSVSHLVLVTNSTDLDSMRVAFFRVWPDGDSEWVELGPDGYRIQPTHWMPLPAPPDAPIHDPLQAKPI